LGPYAGLNHRNSTPADACLLGKNLLRNALLFSDALNNGSDLTQKAFRAVTFNTVSPRIDGAFGLMPPPDFVR
jgi:hypothetical protein